MSGRKPVIGVILSAAMQNRCLNVQARAALDEVGEVALLTMEEPSSWTEPPPYSPESERTLIDFASGKDVLVIGPGAPRITGEIIDAVPTVKLIVEVEGDRFAQRIALEDLGRREVTVVDTTHGSSYPVAEWALALMLIGLRNAGELFRRLIAGETVDRDWKKTQIGYSNGDLAGKRVGIIGAGFIGRHLIRLLRPFGVSVAVHDPYTARVLADVMDFSFTDLDRLMAESDVVVCTLPLTAGTERLVGAGQIALLPPGAVFVNVGRGGVVDTAALIARLEKRDVIACLDVLDPEPIPADSPLRAMHNVFLSPHIAGVTAQAGPRFVTLAAEEIKRFWAGHEPRYVLVPRV